MTVVTNVKDLFQHVSAPIILTILTYIWEDTHGGSGFHIDLQSLHHLQLQGNLKALRKAGRTVGRDCDPVCVYTELMDLLFLEIT